MSELIRCLLEVVREFVVGYWLRLHQKIKEGLMPEFLQFEDQFGLKNGRQWAVFNELFEFIDTILNISIHG